MRVAGDLQGRLISSAYRHNSMRMPGEGGVHGNCTSTEAGGGASDATHASEHPVAAVAICTLLGCDNPASRQFRVDTVGQGLRSD